MRLKTGIKLSVVAAAVALAGFGLGLSGGTGVDSGAGHAAALPVVAIDRSDPQPAPPTEHDRLDCPDRGDRPEPPATGHGV